MRNFRRNNRNSEMPATLTDATRSALWVLVEREERRVGSRGVALEIVAQTVGMSSSWRKIELLRGELNAVTSGFDGLVDREA